MNRPEQHDYSDEPDHSIIERPYQYRIIEMVYHVDLEHRLDSYIDLTLVKGSTTRWLRFWGPQGLQIEEGFPDPTGGMKIIDISKRQWQHLGVAVLDFEASHGAITFWAKDVTDLDAP